MEDPTIGCIVVNHQDTHAAQLRRSGHPFFRTSPVGTRELRRKLECASLSDFALYQYLPLHQLYESFGDTQSQAGATIVPGRGSICLLKRFKDLREFLRLNANSRIPYLEHQH